MHEKFAECVLGPLLLVQGLYTRWVTPRLLSRAANARARPATARHCAC